jgi:hypothetical protein
MAGLKRSVAITALAQLMLIIALSSPRWQEADFTVGSRGRMSGDRIRVKISVGVKFTRITSELTRDERLPLDLVWSVGQCGDIPSAHGDARDSCDALGRASSAVLGLGVTALVVGILACVAPFVLMHMKRSVAMCHMTCIYCSNICAFFIFIGSIIYATVSFDWLPGAAGAPQSLQWSFFLFIVAGILCVFSGSSFYVETVELFRLDSRVPRAAMQSRRASRD